MRIDPPTFPLTPSAFAVALKTGHGRALQQVHVHGAQGLEDAILAACLRCPTYDPQCEADRVPWLLAILDRAGLRERALQAIESAMEGQPSEDIRDMEHRSALLKEFAAAGSIDARRLLYASLARWPHTADVIGAEQILALDGVEGLLHVARQFGRWLQADPDFCVSGFDITTDIEGGVAALEREAAVDADVANYLACMRKAREAQGSHRTLPNVTNHTGADIVALVHSKPTSQCHWFRIWGASAASEELEIVFAALLVSHVPEHVKRLFRCFGKAGAPRFDALLLPWITHTDGQVQWAALQALRPVTHPQLRQAALRMIQAGDVASGAPLLVNNFQTGDFALCEQQLKELDDADDTHHLAGMLLDLCEAHPGAAALGCLLYVYELSPCSECRRRAVKVLVDAGIAPTQVLAECAFDVEPDTRDFVSTQGRPS